MLNPLNIVCFYSICNYDILNVKYYKTGIPGIS